MTVPPVLESMMTTAELAEALGKTPGSLAQWRSAGAGPAYYRIGGKIYYAAQDVADWMQTMRVATAESRS